MKSAFQSNGKKFTDKHNSVSVLRQVNLLKLNFYFFDLDHSAWTWSHQFSSVSNCTLWPDEQVRYSSWRKTDSVMCRRFRLLSEEGQVVASSDQSTFCGQFSDDGQRFVSACQGIFSLSASPPGNRRDLDFCIRLYDTSSSQRFELISEIRADDVGWSILDTALSSDRSSMTYSTWADCSKWTKKSQHARSKRTSHFFLRSLSGEIQRRFRKTIRRLAFAYSHTCT